MYPINPNVRGLTCLRCHHVYETEDPGTGCESCLQQGYPASLAVEYKDLVWENDAHSHGMKRYHSRLPYLDFPTLGEGDTPLLPLPQLADELGLEELLIKNEGYNPTGSHKDRMSALAVARAASAGFKTVVAASTGNAGTSLAAYAAAAGLRCVIIVTPSVHPIWLQAMLKTGAEVVATRNPKDRWKYMKQQVEREGWFPVTNYIDPPVGSNPYGVQGYKTIAYEILDQCTTPPSVIVVPTSRGDLLWGIWEGFKEAKRAGVIDQLPRMIAVEPFPRLSAVLEGADYRQDFTGDANLVPSIGGSTVTYQSLQVLRESKGTAVNATGSEAESAQSKLGGAGIYLERSSATALVAVEKLLQRKEIDQGSRVVMIGTSNGYKELTMKDGYQVEMVF